MHRRPRSRAGANRSRFSDGHASNPLRRASRLLRFEDLEPRRLLAADDVPVLPADVPAEVSSAAAPSSDTNQILVKLRDRPTPALAPLVQRGPATALASQDAFYPLSDVLLVTGAEAAEAVLPQLAPAPGQTGRWVPPAGGEAEPMPASGEAAERAELGRWFRLELVPGADVQAALAALGGMAEVEAAETNIAWGLSDEIPPVIEGLPDATTDPAYDEQWYHGKAWTWKAWDYLNHNGIYPGGTQDVVVAVIDSGVDYNHEDLKANMWVNPGEIPGNGIDDDGNGFKDDVHGASVVSNPALHTGDPIDYHGHGTHVAGIIAAQGYNGQGGVGVAFNTRIMAVRAAQYSGTLTIDDIAEGILYAVDNGADVINMSFGGPVRSQIVEDALQVALNQAVLVAAAGNDSMSIAEMPFYPAALPYVLGVEASTPNGTLADFSNYGYDIMAPGVSIYSTLPGNQYAAWSGTSMATPVVSGVAALMRSYFWQRDVYSSRFIMGCIAASGDVVDAYKALTEPPKPGVSLYQTWLFDQATIDPANDGDGRADAGETLHIGFELVNRSGQADHVIAILDAYAPGASQPDPYAEVLSNTVVLQGIGPFATDDNGLIYNAGGVITGVEAPWIVQVKPDAPNDHVLNFVVTIYFEDGWDPEHPIYTRLDEFQFIVQRGRNLPPVIGEDMTLAADDFWIVGGPVLVEPGVTLTVEPGTQIQWGAISSDPYNPGPQTGYMIIRGALRVAGTQDAPVSLFPSYLVSGQTVDIRAESGDAQLAYVKVRNPNLTNLYSIDHGYLDWDLYSSTVEAWHISNTIFHKFRGGGSLTANWDYDTVLFDAGWIPPSGGAKINNSVFLQDNENNRPITYSPVMSYDEAYYPSDAATSLTRNLAIEHNGYTYAIMQGGSYQYLQAAELAADYFGGEVVSIPDQDEQNFLMSYWSAWMNQDWGFGRGQMSLMGLRPKGAGEFEWPDGSPVYFTNWLTQFGFPAKNKGAAHSEGVWFSCSGYYCSMGWSNDASGGWYLIRIPGRWTKEQINAPFLDGRIDAYIEQRLHGIDQGNAFLSKYWDPSITRWMRVSSPGSSTPLTAHVRLEENFWGTTNPTLINHAIIDYNDNFTTAHVDYGTPLEQGAETAYPFVDSVLINGIPAEQVPTIGAGPVTFTVNFNRDMDPQTQPFVAFGPATPFTDYEAHPVGGNDAGYNSNTIPFTVRLSQPASQPVTVDYATEDGTARAGVDYEATSGKLTFEAGETQKTVAVRVLGDIELEADEDFRLVLSQPVLATLADAVGVATLVDDELTLSLGDVALWEGNGATSLAVFPVTLSEASAQVVSVSYETVDGTALARDDYVSSRGTVTFQPGETVKTLSVPVLGNTVNQPDRSFSFRLTHPRVANLAGSLGEATIRDDDFLLAAEEVRVVEGDADTRQAVFTVRLSGPSPQTVTVSYATVAGTATEGTDYQAASGTLTFAPGVLEQTLAVTVNGDTDVELNETFLVRLSNAAGATLVASDIGGVIVGDDGPLVSINDVTYVELDSSRNDAVFTVTLSANPATAVTVNYSTPNLGTATLGAVGLLGADYHPASGTLTFNPGGALQQTVRVSVAGDAWVEDHETFLVELSSTTAAISDHRGQATIVNDDPYFAFDDVSVVEGDAGTANAVFTVRLVDCPAAETVTVNYTTVAGSAAAGEDFVPQSGTLTFAPGQPREQTVSVPILGDVVDEVDEDFQILLSTPSGAIILDYVAQAIIVNDDRPTLQITDAAIVEGDTGLQTLAFPVRLSHPAAETVTVAWAASDGSATAGDDYRAAAGTLTFQPGEIEQTVQLEVIGETLNELDESFTVTLSNPSYATLADAAAIGTITDDDNPTLAITDVSAREGAAGTTIEAVFTVSLSEPSTETISVDFATADGSANAGTDYQARSGVLTFSPGQTEQTIAVTVVGDDAGEVNETFSVALSGAVNAVLGDAQGQATIVGDDGPLLEVLDSQLVEGDTGTSYLAFPVRLSTAAATDVQVSYATANGTALAGTDYGAASGVVIFTAGQTEKTVLVPVLGDLQNESDEAFRLRLISATVVGIADDEAIGTIVDDDPVLTVNDLIVTEGSGGQTAIEFTVSLSRRPLATKPVSVRYDTTAWTATAGNDYLQVGGTLSFTSDIADPLAKTVTVLVQGDITNEVDEYFFLTLSNPSGAALAAAYGRATILDDDGPKFLVSDATLTEGDAGETSLVFTVSLSQASPQEVSVAYATADGTARAGLDYQPTSGTLTFATNETSRTVSVPVLGDLVDEVDETLLLQLSGGSGIPLADASGQGIIVDDDAATLSVDDVQQPEGFDGWLNSRTWQGVFWVTPMTGESYHQMRISRAVAADDPWLVSGYDVGRFRFQVKTMGVAAMTLQATGQEGAIRLSWAQDDFDLLAGYHLYRATSATGTYTRLNSTIIPVGSESFVDTNVSPAVPLYYKFTVVQTDMTESDPSNVASAAALDTIPPAITHTPKTSAVPGSGLRLTATVTDNVAVEGVAVHYRPRGSTQAYVSLPMINVSGTSWSATIPGTSVQPPGVDYYLTAQDEWNTVYHGTAAAPHSVLVTAAPSLTSVSPNQGAVDGGLRVTLSGTQFLAGASVEFGGVPATDVVVQTSGQILCTTPPHFPALVDVRVVNPDHSETTLLNGFRYVDDDAVLSLPTLSADHGAILDIPISLAQVDGLRAAQLTVTFDSAVLKILSASTGTLTSGWALEANTATAGRVILTLAGGTASSGDGTLAKLRVEVLGAVAAQTALSFNNVLLNDGAIEPDLSNGLFAVNGFFALSGSVKYYQANRPISGAELELVGVGAQSASSDGAGVFSFTTVQTGAYTLTPDKADQAVDITAYDAALILQAAAGKLTLTTNQRLAADVNRNGSVSAMDASYVLEKSVGLLPGLFPGAGRSWLFTPSECSYPLLNGNLANQDFTAILLGDVSGDWDGVGDGGGEPESAGTLDDPPPPSVTLTLPDVVWTGAGTVEVPLQIARGGADVHALDLRLAYDARRLSLQGVTPGSAAEGAAWAANSSQAGLIRIGLASGNALPQDGDLVTLAFQVTGSLATPAAVSLQRASVDEGAVASVVESGYVADATPPAVGVQERWTNDPTPALSGIVDDALAAVNVTVAGKTYAATNRGDGTWILPAATISPPLADGPYDVQVQAWDVLARSGVDATANELMIDTAIPAVSGRWPATGAVKVPLDPELSLTFGEPVHKANGTLVVKRSSDGAVVETIDVASPRVSVAEATATIAPAQPLELLTEYYLEVSAGAFQDRAGNASSGLAGAAGWHFTVEGFRPRGLQAQPNGVAASFNVPLNAGGLNLVDGAGGTLGAADVVVQDASGRPLAGSLVVAADRRSLLWVATQDVLGPGTYTVTLKSGATAFADAQGHALDGDGDGASGGDYQEQFTVPVSSQRVLSLPDAAVGAGQAVRIPASTDGWPIFLDKADGVTAFAFDASYDPALLTVSGGTRAAGLPADWTVTVDASTPGTAKVTAAGSTSLSGTHVELVRLLANVSSSVAYGGSQAVRLESVSLNGGGIAAIGDVAVHKAAYLGDTDGSGIHSAADAFLVVQAALGLASGFAAHAWTDPRVVGDVDGSGVLSAADAFLIVQEGLGLSEPFVPNNPGIPVTPLGGGVDPQFRIDTAIPAVAGGVVTVPVMLDIEPAATNVGAIDFVLDFDPAVLTIDVPAGVLPGADTAAGWGLSAALVGAGQLRVGLVGVGSEPLAAGLREIAQLQFHVAAHVATSLRAADNANASRLHVEELDIEPVDPRAGGYTWTAIDGSLAIEAVNDSEDWSGGDWNAEFEDVLAELAGDVASAGIGTRR